mgnify:CR=1 FL=1
MKKLLTCLLIFGLSINLIQAQEKTITGTVIDDGGMPLPGATIQIKSQSKGTTTDFDGKYTLKAKDGDILVFSYVGYATQEITVKGQTVIDATLSPDNDLDEVVIMSFGKQKKRNVISSVASVKPTELKIASSNLTTALAGKVPGLISYQRGGEPGRDNAEFFVRGVTTFGYASSPLILIDGVELSVSDLRRLHPDDIAEFSIMKDASATALYGARGANGVIFVTTKEGVEGPVRVTVRMETSMSQPTRDIELADPITYMRLGNEAVKTRDPLGLLPYSLKKIENTVAGTNPLLYPTTDWYEELFKDSASSQRMNFSLNGGGKTARYYISVAGSQDNGILEVPKVSNFNSNIKFKQYNLRSSTNINLTETSKLKLSFNVNFEDYVGPMGGGSDVYNMVMRTNPVLFKPFYEKDEANEFTNHILFGNYGNGDYLNPYAQMVRGYQEGDQTKIIAQLEFNQDFDFIFYVLMGLLMLTCSKIVVGAFKHWMLRNTGVRISKGLLVEFFNRVLKKNISFFHTNTGGKLIELTTGNIRIERFFTDSLNFLIETILKTIIYGFILFYFDPKICFVFLGTLVIGIAWDMLFVSKRALLDKMRFRVSTKLRGEIIETVQGIFDIKDAIKDEEVIKNLIRYFWNLENCPYQKNKGLLIFGEKGQGKTLYFKILQKCMVLNKRFKYVTCKEVESMFSLDGDNALSKFKNNEWLFDDLGDEKHGNHFGRKIEAMEHILFGRYESFQNLGLKTYVTTNLDLPKIDKRYGDRVADRTQEMFNFIDFNFLLEKK